ncbi:MAG: GH92 family glycosyl hydrolase [Phycisphaerae bacterium]
MACMLSRKFSFEALTIMAVIILSPLALLAGGIARGADLAALVNPFVGTAQGGDIEPGASTPFGMVELSPDMHVNSYYIYQQHHISGFSMTHLSGVGCPSYGDVFFTATTGPLQVQPKQYGFDFSHKREAASPGYYRVFMKTWGINAQLTATTHCGMAKFTFPAGKQANILVPISHTLTTTVGSNIHIVNDHTITGSVTSLTFCQTNEPFTVYFVMKFSQPFKTSGVWQGNTITPGGQKEVQARNVGAAITSTQAKGTKLRLPGPPIGAFVSYPKSSHSRVVKVRIGISFVSVDGAEKNLAAEMPNFKCSAIRMQAHARWNKALAVITVHGGTLNRRKIFYTALYHALLLPNVFDDVDGRYIGYDNKIHHVPAGHRHIYANWSGWDIYRSEMPLLTIIEPQRVQDMAQSVVEMSKQLGFIDRWPFANRPTGVMNGFPLTNCLTEIWQAGLHHFNIHAAYQAMAKQCFPDYLKGHADLSSTQPYESLNGQKYGSILPINTNVASAEETDIAYASLGHLALDLHKPQMASILFGDALQYTSMYNPATMFMQGRNALGAWMPLNKKARDQWNWQFYCEGSAWEYNWLVPEDVHGLIALMGGDKPFAARLEHFFVAGQYDPTNEPDLEAPYLFDYCRQPWRSQYWIAENADTSFTDSPFGLAWSKTRSAGNDDCGEMSAWYVLTQIGLYQVDPGVPDFEITTPRFAKITIHLHAPHSGKTFIITTANAGGKNMYIQSATLDGKPLNKPWLPERMVFQGGTWNVTAGTTPNKNWAAARGDEPPSLSTGPDHW